MTYNFFGPRDRPFQWDPVTWSLTLGYLFDIRVRVHISLIIMQLFTAVWYAPLFHALGLGWYSLVVLLHFFLVFLWVLLHEFGHCFACRWVGGAADDVLLWPLGGLAYCLPPNYPRAHLITVLGGPAVNVALVAIFGVILAWRGEWNWGLVNPNIFTGSLPLPGPSVVSLLLYLCVYVNFVMIVFNALPLYPLDGGRIVHALLWPRMGYFGALLAVTSVGLGTSVVLICVALWLRDLLMAACFGYAAFKCQVARRQLELAGPPPNDEPYVATSGRGASWGGSSWWSGWRERSARRERELGARREAELDRILDKIHREGINSLTFWERRALTQASKRRRRS